MSTHSQQATPNNREGKRRRRGDARAADRSERREKERNQDRTYTTRTTSAKEGRLVDGRATKMVATTHPTATGSRTR